MRTQEWNKLTKDQKTLLANKRVEIEELLDDEVHAGSSHRHNLISIKLRVVAAKFGKAVANDIVREFGLTELFGIPEVE